MYTVNYPVSKMKLFNLFLIALVLALFSGCSKDSDSIVNSLYVTPWEDSSEPSDILGEWREQEGPMALKVYSDSVIIDGTNWQVIKNQTYELEKRLLLKRDKEYRALYWRNKDVFSVEIAFSVETVNDTTNRDGLEEEEHWQNLHAWVDAIDYFPLALGAKWTYSYNDNGKDYKQYPVESFSGYFVLIYKIIDLELIGEAKIYTLERTFYRYADPDNRAEGIPDMSDTASTFDWIGSSEYKIRKQGENIIFVNSESYQDEDILLGGGFTGLLNFRYTVLRSYFSKTAFFNNVATCYNDLLVKNESCIFFGRESSVGANISVVRGLGITCVDYFDSDFAYTPSSYVGSKAELVEYIPGSN